MQILIASLSFLNYIYIQIAFCHFQSFKKIILIYQSKFQISLEEKKILSNPMIKFINRYFCKSNFDSKSIDHQYLNQKKNQILY